MSFAERSKVSDGSEWRDGCAGEGGGAAGGTRTDVRSTALFGDSGSGSKTILLVEVEQVVAQHCVGVVGNDDDKI